MSAISVTSNVRTVLQPIADIPESGVAVLDVIDGRPMLRGSLCSSCGAKFFPTRAMCIACTSDELSPVNLADTGTLYSVTTVRVSSVRSVPYTIGFVDLDDGVRILASIQSDPAIPELDSRVQLAGTNDDNWSFIQLTSRP